jgi:hypothetical protein
MLGTLECELKVKHAKLTIVDLSTIVYIIHMVKTLFRVESILQ